MFDSPLSASAYQVLDVEPTVDEEALRKAYRLRVRQTHPDTGGEASQFIQVQRAWELVGTPEARAAYDRGHGFGAHAAPSFSPDAPAWRPPSRPADTRPRARSYGQPGGWRRERYLILMREWVGRGVELEDPYDPALVRRAPRQLRRMLADALAEEATARIVADLGMGYTVWHDVAAGREADEKVDHLVLGPSGLYGVLSEDFGGPVRVRRGELFGEGVEGSPVATSRRRTCGPSRERPASASAERSSSFPTTTSSIRSTRSDGCAVCPSPSWRAARCRPSCAGDSPARARSAATRSSTCGRGCSTPSGTSSGG